MPEIAPFGSWKSPITSDMIVTGAISLGQVVLDGDDVYWLEIRPLEEGRYVIVRQTADGGVADVTPAGFSARTTVHEYGGGGYTVAGNTVIFSNFSDQILYRQELTGQPQPLTPPGMRYADGVVDTKRNRYVCVREDHTNADREAVTAVVAVDLSQGGAGDLLASGHDFFSTPRISPDGLHLAWTAWNHPNMPWNNVELWLATINADGSLGQATCIANAGESIFQPTWSPDNTLYFVSDRSGWWNLYRWEQGAVVAVAPMDAEFGRPQWSFGNPTYGFRSAEEIICSYTQNGRWQLARLETRGGAVTPIEVPFTSIDHLAIDAHRAVFLGSSAREASAVIKLNLENGVTQALRRSSSVQVEDRYLSEPRALEFPTEGGQTAYGIYYPALNGDFRAPDGERPPLMVISHGGPTGATSSAFSLSIQYWTSRGIAVLDVNYGGSTGYGRAYRERLDGRWGIVDLDDCGNGARFLDEQGEVDGQRLIIRGGSAGGYTTLAALAFRDVFKVGASYFGVSDLEGLATETHKFESRYLDGLIGPYPERIDIYTQRSPVRNTAGFSCPVIFFQGLEDKIVLPNQAEMMVDALRAKGLPVAYLPFEGEQHGFRQAKNIKRALDAELYFYSRILGFELAEAVEPVAIDNLN